MNSEDFKNSTEGFKNLVLTVAIVCGGAWGFYTFNAKLEVQNANAELEISKRNLIERPILVPTLNVDIIERKSDGGWLLVVEVVIANVGNTDTELVVNNNPVSVARVEFLNGVVVGFDNPLYSGERDMPPPVPDDEDKYISVEALDLLAGQSKSLDVVFFLNEPGVYKVEFNGAPGTAVLDRRDKIREVVTRHQSVSADKFVLVGQDPNKRVDGDL